MHLMIDLETLGLSTDAVVCQIGWVFFEPNTTKMCESSLIRVDPQSCIDAGMKVDWSTLAWWMQQEDLARAQLVNTKDKFSIVEAVKNFHNEIQHHTETYGLQGVWSHGASFDIPIIESLCRRFGRAKPWDHRIVRDTRTLFWLSPPDWPNNLHKHQADADALTQAVAVQSAYKKLIAGHADTGQPNVGIEGVIQHG